MTPSADRTATDEPAQAPWAQPGFELLPDDADLDAWNRWVEVDPALHAPRRRGLRRWSQRRK